MGSSWELRLFRLWEWEHETCEDEVSVQFQGKHSATSDVGIG